MSDTTTRPEQTGPLAFADPLPERHDGPLPSADDLRAAAEIAAPLDDENLRKSVEKAVSLSLARGSVDRLV